MSSRRLFSNIIENANKVNWKLAQIHKSYQLDSIQLQHTAHFSGNSLYSKKMTSGRRIDDTGWRRNECIFCRIADGEDGNDIIHQDDRFVVFSDIKPASSSHLLIIPREHIPSIKDVNKLHVNRINEMVDLGREIIEKKLPGCEDIRFGFHWPPFTSINHLHLHAIAPQSSMGFLANLIFKPNSFWFVSPETAIDWIQKNKS